MRQALTRASAVLVPVALSAVALGVILWLTWEPGMVGQAVRALRPGWLAAAAGLVAFRLLLGGLWFRHLSGGRLGVGGGARLYLSRELVAGLTPSSLGGSPIAGALAARGGALSAGEATSILLVGVVTEHVWFLVAAPLVLLATAFVDVFPEALGEVGAGLFSLYLVGLGAWTGLMTWAVLVRPEKLGALARWLSRLPVLRRFEARVAEEAAQWERQARTLRGRPTRFFAAGVGWAAALWLSRYALLGALVWSVAPAADLAGTVTVAARAATLWLSAIVVPTPGGSGGMEGLFVLFFGPLLPEGIDAPMALAWRLLSFYVPLGLAAGVLALGIRRRRLAPASGDPVPGDGATALRPRSQTPA